MLLAVIVYGCVYLVKPEGFWSRGGFSMDRAAAAAAAAGTTTIDAVSDGLLKVFQVYRHPRPPPVLGDECEMVVMDHVFAYSYGHPYVGWYRPPPACDFNSVSIALTVTSRGRQFDRLALMFLGDIEVFRTSTAEPTADGIRWTYRKDMTPYLSLWRRPQKLIFDLGNLVDDLYTGSFNTTLTATFSETPSPPQTADLILPISAQRSEVNVSSAFSLPSDEAIVVHEIPSNASRATISISACGQAMEEFWYSNVLSPDVDTFLNTTGRLYGGSPFREVQLLIDGYLAGVVWPFPIIFTGGIAPGFWRPVVGIDAFDLREPEIDITPWLPMLRDGREHKFQLLVLGLDGQGEEASLSTDIGQYWVVTGKILVFADVGGRVESGADDQYPPSIFAPDPIITATSSVGQAASGTNETLSSFVKMSRSIVISSETGSWMQNLEYTNHNLLTAEGLTQSTNQKIDSRSAGLDPIQPERSFSLTCSYPLSINTTIGTFDKSPGISIDASLSRGLEIDSTGRSDVSLFSLTAGESKLVTSQSGTSRYSSQPNRSYSSGHTIQDFWESSSQGITIAHVETRNGSVASREAGVDSTVTLPHSLAFESSVSVEEPSVPYRRLRDTVGRGLDEPGRISFGLHPTAFEEGRP